MAAILPRASPRRCAPAALERPIMAERIISPESCGSVPHHTSRTVTPNEPGARQSCPKVAQQLSTSCPRNRNLAKARPTIARSGQRWPTCGQKSASCLPTLANLGRTLAEPEQPPPSLGNVGAGFAGASLKVSRLSGWGATALGHLCDGCGERRPRRRGTVLLCGCACRLGANPRPHATHPALKDFGETIHERRRALWETNGGHATREARGRMPWAPTQ